MNPGIAREEKEREGRRIPQLRLAAII